MIAALWFGKKEPSMPMYFKQFLHECRDLYDTGITWRAITGQVIHSKVITLNCVLDSVAKPMLQNIKQFNGGQSCPYCYHPGMTFGESNMAKWPMMNHNVGLMQDKSFVYSVERYDAIRNDFIEYQVKDRNDEEMRRDMVIAQDRRDREAGFQGYRGLKGKSPMFLLPFFDVCAGFNIDYMHAVLVGTCKHVASLWFDSCNHEADYYIKASLPAIDERLLALTPPTSISRRPRSLGQRKDWHANEWRSWLLFYSLPCLKGILPLPYYKHHCILVSAIYIFLKDSISRDELESATWELGEYVCQFQDLYSVEDMFFNLHLLLHIGKSVSLWGPLWCYSMFSFESSNNSLIKLVKGTTGVASQIVTKYSICRFLPNLLKVYEIQEEVSNYCSDLMCYRRFSNSFTVEDITLVGHQKFIQLTGEERLAFTTIGLLPTGVFYERMIKRGMLYHARLYSRRGRRSDDSVIRFNNGEYAAIQRIIVRLDGDVVLLVRSINVNNAAVITSHPCGSKAKHIKLCRPIVYGNLCFAHARDVQSKCVFMACGINSYIADFPNTVEKD
jgi:hypothetical protein